jgi:hypothetical protein
LSIAHCEPVHIAPPRKSRAPLGRQNPAQHRQVVAELAGSHGLMLVEGIPMPANNPSIVFRRREPAKSADS